MSSAKVIPAPTAYDAPADVLHDRGNLFAFIMATCYGTVPGTLLAKMDISRQTMFAWRQPGAGVPYDRKEDIEKLIDDPEEPFRLPSNADIDLILRPLRGRTPQVVIRNPYLIDLLMMIVSGRVHNLSAGTLDGIIKTHMHGIKGPHIFFRWAYASGGVPASHITRFQNAMHHYGVPPAMNMSEAAFNAYLNDKLAAHDAAGAGDDGDDD